MTTLKSEVEQKQNEVKIGTQLYYSDACNLISWTVTQVHDFGFEAIDEDGFEDVFVFSELQKGWEFKKNLTKKYN